MNILEKLIFFELLIKKKHDSVVHSLLNNTRQFFMQELQGSTILIPYFLYALAHIWVHFIFKTYNFLFLKNGNKKIKNEIEKKFRLYDLKKIFL